MFSSLSPLIPASSTTTPLAVTASCVLFLALPPALSLSSFHNDDNTSSFPSFALLQSCALTNAFDVWRASARCTGSQITFLACNTRLRALSHDHLATVTTTATVSTSMGFRFRSTFRFRITSAATDISPHHIRFFASTWLQYKRGLRLLRSIFLNSALAIIVFRRPLPLFHTAVHELMPTSLLIPSRFALSNATSKFEVPGSGSS